MTTKFYIFLIVIFGFLMMPTDTFACGTKSEKSCCKKEITKSSCKKECCQKKSKDKGCEGKCGKSTCSVKTISFGIVIPLFDEITNNTIVVALQKSNFFDMKTNVSSGFYNIWLPPVIG